MCIAEHTELKNAYWKKSGRHLWSSRYFGESIGMTNKNTIAKYIDDQLKKEIDFNDTQRY
ncbi:transposase [Trichococcus patagoniensis]|uniref:transposase n=1 Tax=Trichococcus patagoniensis TaxID=382641 RepID=UPI003CCBCBC3